MFGEQEGVLTFLTQELHIFSLILVQTYDFLKLHYVEMLLKETDRHGLIVDLVCLGIKKNNSFLLSWLNKQTDLKGQHSFILFYFVWRTLPPF